VPPGAGAYTLHVNVKRCWDCTAHDSFRLFVDGKLAIENHGAKGELDRATMQFSDTQAHAIRLEYLHTGEDEGVVLEWEPPAEALLAQAVQEAAKADVIVAFVGLSPDLEGEALQVHLSGFNGGDRTSLDLPDAQRTLLDRLSALHKPLVVVLTSGSVVDIGPGAKDADAILEAWYPGEAGGEALSKLLDGEVNPSGRLPVTFYHSAAELPPFTDYSMTHRTYRYFDGPVFFPFGFGLSYVQFQYGPVRLSTEKIKASRSLIATVKVRNISRRAGGEVTELYLRPPQTPGAPRLTLRGVERVWLRPRQTQELKFTLTPDQMSTVNAEGVRAVRPGTYRLFLGGSQPDLNANKGVRFRIEGEMPLPQ
jgi:beta-glucosidase